MILAPSASLQNVMPCLNSPSPSLPQKEGRIESSQAREKRPYTVHFRAVRQAVPVYIYVYTVHLISDQGAYNDLLGQMYCRI